MGIGIIAIGFDCFPRDRTDKRKRKHVREAEVGYLEPDAQRVPIHQFESRYFGIVVETAGLLGLGGKLVESLNLAFEQKCIRRSVLWIEKALDRIRIVARRQFALLTLKCRVGREINTFSQLKRVGLAVVRDFRQPFCHVRYQLRRTRQIVVGQQRIEYRFDNRTRVIVGHLHRVETCFGNRKCNVQDLCDIGSVRGGG